MSSSREDCCFRYVLSTAGCKYSFWCFINVEYPIVRTFMCLIILSTFAGLPPPKRIPDDIIMLPTGMPPMDGWESQFLAYEQDKHSCRIVILVPILVFTRLSHSDRHTGQNWNKSSNEDSATRNKFCWWTGAFLGDSLWKTKVQTSF